MKTPKSLKLIDGNFSPEEALEILLNLFSSKIQFHQNKNFSSQIRFGKEDAMATKRTPELKGCIEELSSLVKEAAAKNQHISITSFVNISISNPVKEDVQRTEAAHS